MSFEIEKNIAFAPRGKYPFRAMDVGDSFFLPSDNKLKTQQNITGAFLNYKPMKFATRQVEGGVRVWRVE